MKPRLSDPILVVGIAPGIATCGMAIVHGKHCLGLGVWRHSSAAHSDESRGEAYILDLYAAVKARCDYPAILACETQFVAPCGSDAQCMAQQQVTLVRGMLCGAAAVWGWRLLSVTPQQASLALAGNGRASKEQMRKMAQARVALDHLPNEHEADALVVALAAQRVFKGELPEGVPSEGGVQ